MIWEDNHWYADAPDSESLKSWLHALKSAIIRSAYAIRKLPPLPPKGLADTGSVASTNMYGTLSDASQRTTPASSIRRGIGRMSSRNHAPSTSSISLLPSFTTLSESPGPIQPVYSSSDRPVSGDSTPVVSTTNLSSVVGGSTLVASSIGRRDVQKLVIDTSLNKGEDSLSPAASQTSLGGSTSGSSAVVAVGRPALSTLASIQNQTARRVKARSWAMQGDTVSINEIKDQHFAIARSSPRLVDQATSPINSRRNSKYPMDSIGDALADTHRVSSADSVKISTTSGTDTSQTTPHASIVATPSASSSSIIRPLVSRRVTTSAVTSIPPNANQMELLSVMSSSLFGRSSGEESSSRLTTPDMDEGGGASSSTSGWITTSIAQGPSRRIRADTVSAVPSMELRKPLNGISKRNGMDHGGEVLPSPQTESKFKFLSLFQRSSKTQPSTPTRVDMNVAMENDIPAPMMQTRRPSAGAVGVNLLSPVMEARLEELDAPISQGSRSRI